jgi:glycosyltransferase involved in cell wall biosynthesis
VYRGGNRIVVIQVIARVNRGGTANWISVLIRDLRLLGHSVFLVAGNVEPDEIEDGIFHEFDGIRIDSLGRTVSPIKDFRAIKQLRLVLKTLRPDVINTHTFKAGLIGRISSIGLPIRVIHTYHGHLLYGYFSPLQVRIYVGLERFLGLLTDAFIVVGNTVKNDLIDLGIGRDKSFNVIYPAVRMIEFSNRTVLRDRYNLGKNDYVVGWLGRLTAIKRPELFLELATRNPNFKFLIGGDGDLRDTVMESLPKNVTYVGWVKPGDFWPACDIGAITSANEGLPTSLIEAQLAGIPSVGFHVGSINEVILNNKTGFLVTNIEDFSERLVALDSDPSEVTRLALESQEFSQSRFDPKIFINKHIEIYEDS